MVAVTYSGRCVITNILLGTYSLFLFLSSSTSSHFFRRKLKKWQLGWSLCMLPIHCNLTPWLLAYALQPKAHSSGVRLWVLDLIGFRWRWHSLLVAKSPTFFWLFSPPFSSKKVWVTNWAARRFPLFIPLLAYPVHSSRKHVCLR